MAGTATDGREEVLADAEAVAQRVAAILAERAAASTGPFTIALSGGSTPKRLYEILAGPEYASFPWERTRLAFGDERFVPPDDEGNNYRMVKQALLDRVPVGDVLPIPTDGAPADAARRYEGQLKALYGAERLEPGRPLFDVVLLGLGENGHTASLFPDTPVLGERSAWVGCCTPHDAPHDRITLTYPAINSSRLVLFLVAGAGKAEILRRVRGGDPSLPAAAIATEGDLAWMLDRAAAGAHG